MQFISDAAPAGKKRKAVESIDVEEEGFVHLRLGQNVLTFRDGNDVIYAADPSASKTSPCSYVTPRVLSSDTWCTILSLDLEGVKDCILELCRSNNQKTSDNFYMDKKKDFSLFIATGNKVTTRGSRHTGLVEVLKVIEGRKGNGIAFSKDFRGFLENVKNSKELTILLEYDSNLDLEDDDESDDSPIGPIKTSYDAVINKILKSSGGKGGGGGGEKARGRSMKAEQFTDRAPRRTVSDEKRIRGAAQYINHLEGRVAKLEEPGVVQKTVNLASETYETNKAEIWTAGILASAAGLGYLFGRRGKGNC